MKAQEVMDRLAQRYASCSRYVDCGSVFRWDDNAEKTDQRKLVFKTFFERPLKLRFEWWQEIPVEPLFERNFNIVWSDGIQAACYYDCVPEPEVEENLAYAIAGATGISMGCAFAVPALLIPEIREQSNHLLLLQDIRLTESETVGEHECFRIHASSWRRPDDTVLWISKADYSLRKLQEFSVITAEEQAQYQEEAKAEFGDERPESPDREYQDMKYFTLYSYETVTFDSDIPAEMFTYDPKSDGAREVQKL